MDSNLGRYLNSNSGFHMHIHKCTHTITGHVNKIQTKECLIRELESIKLLVYRVLAQNAQGLGLNPQHCIHKACWSLSIVLTLKRGKKEDQKFTVFLCYIRRSWQKKRSDRTLQINKTIYFY